MHGVSAWLCVDCTNASDNNSQRQSKKLSTVASKTMRYKNSLGKLVRVESVVSLEALSRQSRPRPRAVHRRAMTVFRRLRSTEHIEILPELRRLIRLAAYRPTPHR